jgi:hypothetical protein
MSEVQIPERFLKFIEAATTVAAEGQKVTYAAVLAKAGGRGSMTDVAAAIKIWREQKLDQAKPEVIRHDLPAAETEAVLALLGQLWAKAESEAQTVIETERQALEKLRLEIEDEKAQALEAADATMLENESLIAQLATVKADLDSALKASEELQIQLVKAEAKAEAKAETNQLLELLLAKLSK